MVTARTQKARGKKERAAKVAAKERVANGKAEAAKRSRTKTYSVTEEQIVEERDHKGLSWRQVGINLELGGPSAARRAYAELTGRPHSSSQPQVRRAKAGAVATGRKLHTPEWTDESDQDEIEAKLNGKWIEAKGEPGDRGYMPGHWTGSRITVRRYLKGTYVGEEDVAVMRCDSFDYAGKEDDGPLQITVIEKATSAFRTFRVQDIIDVR